MSFLQSDAFRRYADSFDDPHWLYELKHGRSRALAVVWWGHVGFLSETGRWLNTFSLLAALKKRFSVEEAILVS
jgi:hypothetical protein